MARRHHHIDRAKDGRYWQLLVKRSSKSIIKCFHDRRYGGKAAALAQAIAYRDRLLATIPNWPFHSRSSRSSSGTIGVFLLNRKETTQRWAAAWKENGRYCRRAFSARLYGARRAKAMAVALRKQKVAAARPDPPPLHRKPLSNTGVIGVRRRLMHGDPFYVAFWSEDGKLHMRAFSAKFHGEARARALAIKTRRAMHTP